jgi:hypothetical protein
MVQKRTTHYEVQCDWCGLKKEGMLEENGFTTISFLNSEIRKDWEANAKEHPNIFGLTPSIFDYAATELCPTCYEPVKTFFKQKKEEIIKNGHRRD